MTFKVGDFIYRNYHGLDICQIVDIGSYGYKILQFNQHCTGTRGDTYLYKPQLLMKTFKLMTEEDKVELL